MSDPQSPAPTQRSTPPPEGSRVVFEAPEIRRAILRMAHEIVESNRGTEGLVVLGIPTRGVPLAHRLVAALGEAGDGAQVPVGQLDITMFRDDLRDQPTRPVGRTELPCPIDGRTVVLVDDVLFSGRTVSAALDALKDLGRPTAVRLAVLVDRGHRQLPIRADHVGKNLPTSPSERVRVELDETDDRSTVTIWRPQDAPTTGDHA